MKIGNTDSKYKVYLYFLCYVLVFLSLHILVPMNSSMRRPNSAIEWRVMACPVFCQVFVRVADASVGGYDR